MQDKETPSAPDDGKARVGEILHRITDDVKTIAAGEVELARTELARGLKTSVVDAGVVVLGGVVALIGLGMLCVAAVVALEPVIAPLWLRLLIMALAYLVVGSAVAGVFAKRLKKDAPDLSSPANEARRTVQNIKDGLTRQEGCHARNTPHRT